MKPDILLVEDDPVTRAFLTAAAEALPARVEAVASLAEARERVHARHFDLWLFDAHLPDGEGADLLAELRHRGRTTPALAHTAEHEQATLDGLRRAGFSAALGKPLSAAALQAAMRDAIGTSTARDAAPGSASARATDASDDAPAPLWSDAAALAALGGQRAHVDALRALFLDELGATRDSVERCVRAGDAAGLHGLLHRLCASCGFVGASRLDAAVRTLQAQPAADAALREFLQAARDMLSSR